MTAQPGVSLVAVYLEVTSVRECAFKVVGQGFTTEQCLPGSGIQSRRFLRSEKTALVVPEDVAIISQPFVVILFRSCFASEGG